MTSPVIPSACVRLARCVAPMATVLLAVGFAACGDDGGAAPDAGIMLFDASPPDSGGLDGPGTCDAPRMLVGTEGTVSITLDTTDGPAGALDLGAMCGNPAADPRAPQEVIAFTVPGSGPHAVDFTTVTDDTLTNFDTVVQVRRTCTEVPADGFPPTCFDDVSATDARSMGVALADGGDVLYFIVTGLTGTDVTDGIDRGPVSLEITSRANTAPEITGGDVRMVGEVTEVEVTGMDADGDAAGMGATFLDAMGAPVDLNGDGTADDTLLAYFDAPVDGETSFTAVTTLFAIRTPAGPVRINDQLRARGAVSARVAIFDSAFALSGEVTVPMRTLAQVGIGETCDEGHACFPGLRCNGASACEAEPVVAAACARATALSIDTPTDTTMSAGQSGTLAGGFGLTQGSCAHSPGVEALFDITVPDAPVDLVATTDLDGTAGTNTVLYLRRLCADLSTEPAGACNDDIRAGGGNVRSRLVLRDVAAGTYTLFVETVGHPSTTPVPYEVRVSLRPVLASGAACDPTQVDNRCAVGSCAPATSICP